jgi:hypothetical protein
MKKSGEKMWKIKQKMDWKIKLLLDHLECFLENYLLRELLEIFKLNNHNLVE